MTDNDDIPDDIAAFMAAHKEESTVDDVTNVEATEEDKRKVFRTVDKDGNTTIAIDDAAVDIYDTGEEDTLLRDEAGRGKLPVPDVPADADGVIPGNTTFDESAPQAQPSPDLQDAFAKDFDFGSVEVSKAERDMFLSAALLDSSVVFKVIVPGLEVAVDIRMATTKESTSVTDAVNRLLAQDYVTMTDEEKHVGHGAKMLLYYQCLFTYIQVVSVNGVEAYDYDPEKVTTGKQLTADLAKPETIDKVNNMSIPRWHTLLLAQRIAERKLQICNARLLDRSFFEKAGTD